MSESRVRENRMHGLRWRALETGRSRSAIRGSRAGVLRNATLMAWSGPSRPIGRYRASARPYSEEGRVPSLVDRGAASSPRLR